MFSGLNDPIWEKKLDIAGFLCSASYSPNIGPDEQDPEDTPSKKWVRVCPFWQRTRQPPNVSTRNSPQMNLWTKTVKALAFWRHCIKISASWCANTLKTRISMLVWQAWYWVGSACLSIFTNMSFRKREKKKSVSISASARENAQKHDFHPLGLLRTNKAFDLSIFRSQ